MMMWCESGDRPFRLSDHIQTHGSVGRPPNQFDECDSDETFYRLQRHRVLQQMQRNILPLWSEVKDYVLEAIKTRSDEYNHKEVNDLLRQMLDIGREFVGYGSAMDLVESAAVYVIQVFHDAKYLKNIMGVTSQQVQELAQMFGGEHVTTTLVNRAYENSKIIIDLFDTEDRERLFMPFQRQSPKHRSQSLLSVMELLADEDLWNNCQLKELNIDPFEDRLSSAVCVEWDSIMEDSEPKKSFELSFQYKSQPSSHVETNGTDQPSNSVDACEWLNTELTKYIDRYNVVHNEPFYMTIETLVDTVIEWINAEVKTDDELAADLHSLLGDSCLQLIEKVVRNRSAIKVSYSQMYNTEPKVVTNDPLSAIPYTVLPKKRPPQKEVFREKRPAIAPSVVVHTEEGKEPEEADPQNGEEDEQRV